MDWRKLVLQVQVRVRLRVRMVGGVELGDRVGALFVTVHSRTTRTGSGRKLSWELQISRFPDPTRSLSAGPHSASGATSKPESGRAFSTSNWSVRHRPHQPPGWVVSKIPSSCLRLLGLPLSPARSKSNPSIHPNNTSARTEQMTTSEEAVSQILNSPRYTYVLNRRCPISNCKL